MPTIDAAEAAAVKPAEQPVISASSRAIDTTVADNAANAVAEATNAVPPKEWCGDGDCDDDETVDELPAATEQDGTGGETSDTGGAAEADVTADRDGIEPTELPVVRASSRAVAAAIADDDDDAADDETAAPRERQPSSTAAGAPALNTTDACAAGAAAASVATGAEDAARRGAGAGAGVDCTPTADCRPTAGEQRTGAGRGLGAPLDLRADG